jgi:hypothetical protein
MVLLGLDVSSVATGWAVMPGADPLVCGTIRPKGEGWAKGKSFCDQLHALMNRYRVTHIGMEEPLRSDLTRTEVTFSDNPMFGQSVRKTRRPMTNIGVLRKLYAFAGYVHLLAEVRDVPVWEVNQTTWRKSFLGVAHAPKGAERNWLKTQCFARCVRMGFSPDSDDAAEAIGVVHWLQGQLQAERVTRAADALFAARPA